jgi:hypothetical protein
MATAATIKKNIAKLEAALKSKATPKTLKPKLEAQLVKSKAELSGIKKGTKPKTSSTKSTQTALQKLKEMVNKNKKLKTYKGAGVDLEKDADRPAKPIGKRTAKSGNTYYEYRANRIDVKQPPKRYPKLEKGGYMADGGSMGLRGKLEMMSAKYQEWLHKNNLPQMSADELLVDESVNLTDEQRKYIENFYNEWMEEQDKYADGGIIELKSVGTYLRTSDMTTSPRKDFENEGEINFVYENSDEWWDALSEKDRNTIGKYNKVHYKKKAKGGYFSKGGYVAVSEKDGYWYIMSKPTTKEKAQEMINLGVPSGEVGKVVTLDEAKSHKKVIGEEYLKDGGYMAKGGALEHGLMVGDTVRDVAENSVAIYNHNDKKSYVVDLDKGTRTEWIGSFEKEMKYAKHGAYMAMGGEMHRTQE